MLAAFWSGLRGHKYPAPRRGIRTTVNWTTGDGRHHSRRFRSIAEAKRFAGHLKRKHG